MKYPKNKKNNRGVSIVEIVVSMIIIMLVMLVLAFVYPNGRRLTNSSDNRTKATAIAKSILEEIKLIAFDENSAQTGDAALNNLCVLVSNAQMNNYLSLNNPNRNILTVINTPGNNIQWPYHHFSVGDQKASTTGAGWDATVANDENNTPVCPFFISDANSISNIPFNNHPQRPFCLLTQDITANIDGTNKTFPRSIFATPNAGSIVGALNRPRLAIINVTVYWGELRNGNHDLNFVTLTDSRTQNVY